MNEDITQEIFMNLKRMLGFTDEDAYKIIKRKDLVEIYEQKRKKLIDKAIENAMIGLVDYIILRLGKDPYNIDED